MALSVLGIACSPRRKGNTTNLLLESINAAQEEGHHTEVVYLSELNMSPCRGCGACSAKGVCVINDDIAILQDKLIVLDRLIIAAPIYFMGVNAQAKIMIDRMQPFWARKYLHQQSIVNPSGEKRAGMFISTAGTKFPYVFECAERSIKTLFTMLDIEYSQTCLYNGVDKAGEIADYPDFFAEVRRKTETLLMERR
ncbi:multimeric flavodoxin WrbA [Desulfosporosinus orientis DSM 765]|uniref:Multimeric flavodoxin WrbA n=1 Tax=Desulfosporosinus orientis (strain ATCC 19365 / DSM 765 / NCIMB 8382 / VKM B-1628 / Singapore I) TaxID=768706 RepID=G7WBN5_DESOD|nr:flavodoxin family protein [Desulfosporosinus orientis]AET68793.1 multimeric flavodoxin WrbA [Desulfosporosinus orientis DSM 765]